MEWLGNLPDIKIINEREKKTILSVRLFDQIQRPNMAWIGHNEAS